jgi:ankyrin repeat protein
MSDFAKVNERLFAAVESGETSKVKEALQAERLNAATYFGYKSVVCAAQRENTEILEILLASSAKIDRASFWSKPAASALKHACRNGNANAVKLLFEYGVNAAKNDLTEALIEALPSGNIELIKILLDVGANVNISDKDTGITPLMYAVLFPVKNRELIVEALLAAGAHVCAKDRKGRTVVTVAIENGYVAVVKLLAKHRPDLTKKDLGEALLKAVFDDNLEYVRFWLDAGANVNVKNKENVTPLIYAVLLPGENNEQIVEALLAAGARTNAKDNTGRTALMYALDDNNDKIIEMLKNAEKYRNK